MTKTKQKEEKYKKSCKRSGRKQITLYRLTLSAKAVKPLEDVCNQILAKTKEFNFKFRGPVRMPTKTLKITTRKTPCGEGTDTWDRFEMRIHKRIIDLNCPVNKVKEVM